MDHTSLQHIINLNKSSLRDNEVNLLFGTVEYPCFELKELKGHELMFHQSFSRFVSILEGWNKKAVIKSSELKECDYRIN